LCVVLPLQAQVRAQAAKARCRLMDPYYFVRQTPMLNSEFVWMASNMQFGKVKKVKPMKRHTALPIGPTARIAFEIDATRAGCSRLAQNLLSRGPVNEAELEDCARL